jgi:hypothetical protein
MVSEEGANPFTGPWLSKISNFGKHFADWESVALLIRRWCTCLYVFSWQGQEVMDFSL